MPVRIVGACITLDTKITDFEKLVIAKQYIKKLQFELGLVTSERDEYEFELNRFKKMTKPEQKEAKRFLYYEKIYNQLEAKRVQANKLKKTNEELICKIVKLQNR